jgi:predicted transcriptional regulator YheO
LRAVFISHAYEDQEACEELREFLRSQGVEAWDPSQMRPGALLSEELRSAIGRCSACLFLATARSIRSPWCHAELGAFWGAGKNVLVFATDPDLPDQTLPPQYRSTIWARSFEEVVSTLRRWQRDHKPDGTWARKIPRLRLFQYPGFYPIDLGTDNVPKLNRETFVNAIDLLLNREDDRLAATDLVYLRQDNLDRSTDRPEDPDIVRPPHIAAYDKLVRKYDLEWFVRNFQLEKQRVFDNYIRLVNDIGQTLKDVYFEILLHDVRNPIRSIIAAQNSEKISGRKLGDPSTRFVVNYVRNQGRDLIAAMARGSKVAYRKQFLRTKWVKATTTPINDDVYGLVGFLCMNIDIEAIDQLDDSGRTLFFEAYTRNSGKTPAFEREQLET